MRCLKAINLLITRIILTFEFKFHDMKKNLNGFPLDDSMSTQLKYNLFAERMNRGQKSYNLNNQSSTSDAVMLVGGIFKILFSLIGIVFGILKWIFNLLK